MSNMVRRNVPLSQQVVREILSGIEAGNLARENGMLPSEAELGARFDVSRATIREALSQLEQRGVVIRRHGVGTFVSPALPVIESGLEQLESLDTLARRIGLEIHMGATQIAERTATAQEAECLQTAPDAQVLSVARVIMTGERPVAYLVDVVPITLLRRQDLGESFSGSVLDLFIGRGDPALSHSRTEIMVEAANEATARRLHLRRGDPMLKLIAELVARDGRVVDYSLSCFVPGYFRFHVIRRIGGPGGEINGSAAHLNGQ